MHSRPISSERVSRAICFAGTAEYMINVRCLEGVDFTRLKVEKFDGHSWESHPNAPYKGVWKDV
jgi:hypothetical protein